MAQRKIHLVGIGGVGMAGLAVLLKAQGHDVSGCDLASTSRTGWLVRQGIRFFEGHSPEHVCGADEVIVTPAVPAENPERRAAAVVRLRGEALAELAASRETIAVCGSHGKTTTSTWIAKLLRALGEDPAWCIGGETGDFPVAGVGTGPLVVEADESDGTLALYRVRTLVVNRCEYDHPDHFRTEADYLACYAAAKAQAADVIESESLLPLPELEAADWFAALPPHNRANARAAVEVARRRGHETGAILAALAPIVAVLPDRRFERIAPGVYTDYAHHPTEMACAVGMARAICGGTLRVLFQPHRHSRTKALLNDFPAAFAQADEVVLCPTYAAFEPPIEGGDVADLYRVCRAAGVRGLFLARSCGEAWEHARNSMREGDIALLLGAGDIIALAPRVRSDLRASSSPCEKPNEAAHGKPCPPKRRIWIGQGTNTWKSDLNLSVEYAQTSGPAGAPGASLVAAHPTLLPWMAGVPGTVGGWIKMNAGAFGHSISEVLSRVKVDGRWVRAEDCGFGYRTSAIKGEIQDFRLKEPEDVRNLRDASGLSLGPSSRPSCLSSRQSVAASPSSYLARRAKFPPRTYGSFFKNPPGDFAGRLLEAAGAKGLSVGGAHVWREHANVIVRGDGATASDVLALARLMRNRVLFRLGVDLEPEVQGIAF